MNPHAVYMRVYEGFDEVKIDVTVKGGVPKPEVSIVNFSLNCVSVYFEVIFSFALTSSLCLCIT